MSDSSNVTMRKGNSKTGEVRSSADPMNRNSLTRIGASNFVQLVEESAIFVDKTRFIWDFIASHTYAVYIISRPPNWGKTINCSMVKTFASIAVDESGTPIYPTSDAPTSAYKLFTREQPKSGKKLKIAGPQFKDFLDKNLGRHPVININFGDCAKECDYDGMLNAVRKAVAAAFEEHDYLQYWKAKKTTDEITKFYRDQFVDIMEMTSDEADIGYTLHMLSKFLYNYFGRREVVVLIDDYDAGINQILLSWPHENQKKGLALFNRVIDKVMVANKYLKKGLLTGTLTLGDSTLIDIGEIAGNLSLCNGKFSEHFGITQQEMQETLSAYGITDDDEEAELKKWYMGYYTVPGWPDEEFGNLLSLFTQLEDRHFKMSNKQQQKHTRAKSWWANSSSSSSTLLANKIQECMKLGNVRRKMYEMLQEDADRRIELNCLRFDMFDLSAFRAIIDASNEFALNPEKQNWKTVNLGIFYKFLYAFGYMSNKPHISHSRSVIAIVANEEAKFELKKGMYVGTKKIYKWDDEADAHLDDALKGLLNVCTHDTEDQCPVTALTDAFKQLIKPIKFIDFAQDKKGVHENEWVFQSIIGYRALFLSHDMGGKFGGEVFTPIAINAKQQNNSGGGAQTNVVVGKKTGKPNRGRGGATVRAIRGGIKRLTGSGRKSKNDQADEKKKKRADIVYSHGQIGVIIEMKNDEARKPSLNSVTKSAKGALKQIEDRGYATLFAFDETIKIIKFIGLCAACSKGGDKKFVVAVCKCIEPANKSEGSPLQCHDTSGDDASDHQIPTCSSNSG